MQGNLIGYTVLQDNGINSEKAIEHWQKSQPTTLTFVEQYDFARMAHDALQNTLIFYREWPDEDALIRETPEELHSRRKHQAISPRMVLYPNNESGYSPEHVKRTARLMELGRQDGVRYIVHNYAPGQPHETTWQSDAHDKVLEQLDDGFHLLGWHSYSPELELVCSEKWWLWLMVRFLFPMWRAIELGLQPPLIALTEVGHAEYSDGVGGEQGWTQWGLEEIEYANQVIAFAERLREWPNVVGLNVYGFGASPGWERYDVKQAFEFQGRVERYFREQPHNVRLFPREWDDISDMPPTPPVPPPPNNQPNGCLPLLTEIAKFWKLLNKTT